MSPQANDGETGLNGGAAGSAAGSTTCTVLPAGWRFAVPPGQTLLQAALAAGVRLPSSCRNGTCRACFAMLTRGRVRYSVEWPGLSAEEKAEGCTLPCVALPLGDVDLLAPGAARG